MCIYVEYVPAVVGSCEWRDIRKPNHPRGILTRTNLTIELGASDKSACDTFVVYLSWISPCSVSFVVKCKLTENSKVTHMCTDLLSNSISPSDKLIGTE